MNDDDEKNLILAESLLSTSEDFLFLMTSGNLHQLRSTHITNKELDTIQSLCRAVGDVANIANSVFSMIKDIQRIEAETAIILTQLEGHIEIRLAQIKAISSSLNTMQQIVLKIPDDYSNHYLMDKKANIIDRMCDLSIKIAELS